MWIERKKGGEDYRIWKPKKGIKQERGKKEGRKGMCKDGKK